jgi:hypothetical protein
MRISNQPEEEPEEIPLEVQLWLSRGWTIIKTERRGIVLTGHKVMGGRTKLFIALGVVLLGLFYFGALWPSIGAVLLVLAVVDYKFVTKPPTKFFPADGEKKRTLER